MHISNVHAKHRNNIFERETVVYVCMSVCLYAFRPHHLHMVHRCGLWLQMCTVMICLAIMAFQNISNAILSVSKRTHFNLFKKQFSDRLCKIFNVLKFLFSRKAPHILTYFIFGLNVQNNCSFNPTNPLVLPLLRSVETHEHAHLCCV